MMKRKWICCGVAALSMALLLASCGGDPSEKNPDNEGTSDDVVVNVPDTTPEDTVAPETGDTAAPDIEPETTPEETTAPEEVAELPVNWDLDWGELISKLTDVGLREYGDMEEEIATSYGYLLYDNVDQQGHYDGGYMYIAMNSSQCIGYMELEFPATYNDVDVCDIIMAAFDDDTYEYWTELYTFIEENIAEGGEIVLGNVRYRISPGVSRLKPLRFTMEAEGAYVFIAAHP